MYEELAAVGEIVDLSPQELLGRAENFLARLGYVTLRRAGTSLTVMRDRPGRPAKEGVLALTVVASPDPGGGVRVVVRGNDQEGVSERQAEWNEWADSLPKRGGGQRAGETAPPREPEDRDPTAGAGSDDPREQAIASVGRNEAQAPTEEFGEDAPFRRDIPETPEGLAERRNRPAAFYEYKMVHVPPAFATREGDGGSEEAARWLESLANRQAEQGWEFYRVDTLAFADRPGRLGALFGEVRGGYCVATFRRPR